MNTGLVKVVFPIEQDSSGFPPVAREGIWVSAQEPWIGTIDSIPFFVRTATFGDKVRFKAADDEFVFDEVLERSPNALLRVLCYSSVDPLELQRTIRMYGADTEFSKDFDLVAVSVPPGGDLAGLRAYLAAAENNDELGYEEAILP